MGALSQGYSIRLIHILKCFFSLTTVAFGGESRNSFISLQNEPGISHIILFSVQLNVSKTV